MLKNSEDIVTISDELPDLQFRSCKHIAIEEPSRFIYVLNYLRKQTKTSLLKQGRFLHTKPLRTVPKFTEM